MQPWASRDVPRSAVSTFGLPCTHSASGSARVDRVVPGAGRELHDAGRTSSVTTAPARQRAAVVEDAHDVAVGDAARGGVVGVDADRLAAGDLGAPGCARRRRAGCAGASPAGWRSGAAGTRSAAAPPSHSVGLEPGRVAGAVVVAEAGDRLGEELDRARSACRAAVPSGSARNRSNSTVVVVDAPGSSSSPAAQNSSNGGDVDAARRPARSRQPLVEVLAATRARRGPR